MFILLKRPLLPFSPVKFYDPVLPGKAVGMQKVSMEGLLGSHRIDSGDWNRKKVAILLAEQGNVLLEKNSLTV